MSVIERTVIEKIQSRSSKGLKEYDHTMDRTDLTTLEWFVHLQEELLDAAIYLEKLIHIARNPELHGE